MTSKIFFSSDFHLNHGNIVSYCSRPFKTLEEMNETIIKNFNDRVKEDDTVFFLGDFCFRNSLGGKKGEGLPDKAGHFIKQLNGKIIFIKGNHDARNSLKTPIEKIYLSYGGHRICLVHNPKHVDSTCSLNLIGHVHNAWKIKRINKNSIMYNVGVDVHSFKPISFEEISKDINQWKREEKKDGEKEPRTKVKEPEKKRV